METFIKTVLFCFAATAAFGFIMSAPLKSIPISSLIATIGYLIYLYIHPTSEIAGYFIGTFVITFLGELGARIMKMPATIFIFPGVIPLVPGVGIYNTMTAFVNGDIQSGVSLGFSTCAIAGSMAMAMAVGNMIFIMYSKIKTTNKVEEI